MEDPIIDLIADDVHKAWMQERIRQGFADHAHRFVRQNEGIRVGACRPQCTLNVDEHHPDMIPYEDLAPNIQEYDRVTARAVLAGLRRRGYILAPPYYTGED
jgi:hypothetical protein